MAGLICCCRSFSSPLSSNRSSCSLLSRPASLFSTRFYVSEDSFPCQRSSRGSLHSAFAISGHLRALEERKSKANGGARLDGRENASVAGGTVEFGEDARTTRELEKLPMHEDMRWPCVRSELPDNLGIGDLVRQAGTSEANFVRASGSSSTVLESPIYHNVQDGETLTSIARRYRTSVHWIAEMNDIPDIDSLQAGQVLLIHRSALHKMPSVIGNLREAPASKYASGRATPSTIRVQIQNANLNSPAQTDYPPITILNLIKALIPLLVLVLVFVFCVRSIFDRLYSRLRLDVSKQQAEKEVWAIQHRPKLKRWQTILAEDRDTEEFGFSHASQVDPADETEEQRRVREFEEIRNQYSSLETTYMKFLADSGLARSGYWRGGASAAQDRDTR